MTSLQMNQSKSDRTWCIIVNMVFNFSCNYTNSRSDNRNNDRGSNDFFTNRNDNNNDSRNNNTNNKRKKGKAGLFTLPALRLDKECKSPDLFGIRFFGSMCPLRFIGFRVSHITKGKPTCGAY